MTTPARLLTVATTLLISLFAGASAAVADTPVSPDWPAPEPTSYLELLVIIGGSVVGLYVVITLFAMLTARNNYVPPPPSQDLATTSDDVAHH